MANPHRTIPLIACIILMAACVKQPSPEAPEYRGHVLLEDETDHAETRVVLFNGFETEERKTGADGGYTFPLGKSTLDTIVFVLAAADGYVPQATLAPAAKAFELPDLVLEKAPAPDAGHLIGVCYITVIGGKLRPHFGIAQAASGLSVQISGRTSLTTRCNEQGIYYEQLVPGRYTITSEVGLVKSVDITSGTTTIVHLLSGGTRVD